MLFHGFRLLEAHYTRGYAYSTATRSGDRFAIAALGFALCRVPNRVEGRLCAGMTGRDCRVAALQ